MSYSSLKNAFYLVFVRFNLALNAHSSFKQESDSIHHVRDFPD